MIPRHCAIQDDGQNFAAFNRSVNLILISGTSMTLGKIINSVLSENESFYRGVFHEHSSQRGAGKLNPVSAGGRGFQRFAPEGGGGKIVFPHGLIGGGQAQEIKGVPG